MKISEETAVKLILNNANVSYFIRICRTYNRRLRLTSLFKDYNINILLFWYEILNGDLARKDKMVVNKSFDEKKEDPKSTYDNKVSKEISKKKNENTSKVLNNYPKDSIELNIENNTLTNDILPIAYTFKKSRNNLYYRFRNYTKEEISAVIKDLSFDEQSIIRVRYDLDGNYKSGSISKNVQNKLKVILNSKIPRNLKKLRFNRLIDFLYLHYYNAYTVDKIIEVLNFLGVDFQDNLYQSLDFINDLPIIKNEVMLKKCLAIFNMHIKRVDKRDTLIHEMKVIWGNSNDKLIKVLLMKLGLLDGKFYSDIEISIILEISLKEVAYKEMLRELVRELQTPLKKSLKK